MNTIIRIICSLVFILISANAQTRYQLPCDSAADAWKGRICASEELAKATNELTLKYQHLLQKIRTSKASSIGTDTLNDARIEETVIRSQQQWLEYYDSVCKIRENLWEGGSGMSQAVTTIATQITRERILEIDELLEYYKAI